MDRGQVGTGVGCVGLTRVFFAVALLTGWWSRPALAQSTPKTKVVVARPAAWITTHAVPAEGPIAKTGTRYGAEDLLLDQQINVGLQQRYIRKASRVLTPSGAESLGKLQIEFEPSFQTLLVHNVSVVREGRAVEVISPLQRRPDLHIFHNNNLDHQMYDGSVTAAVIIPDLRVGDILDFAYSVVGYNPVFAGRYARTLSLGTARGVRASYLSVRVPAARSMHVQESAFLPKASETRLAADIEYSWSIVDVAAPSDEENLPSWFRSVPTVSLSEYGSWNDVARWGSTLFAVERKADGAVSVKARELAQGNTTTEARTLAALRFVQHDVRYLGIELGQNSHRPHAPELVLRQRFGDCKDKTLLLIELLREMGVNAYPVLVSTSLREHLAGQQPTSDEFDHVVARVELEGRSVWVDSTRSDEFGALGQSYVRFARGLELQPSTEALSSLEQAAMGPPTTVQVDVLNIESTGEATLNVRVTYERDDATWIRSTLDDSPRETIMRERLDEVAKTYADAERVGDMDIHDDRAANIVTIRESFHIKQPFVDEQVTIRAGRIREQLRAGPFKQRRVPLRLGHPEHARHEVYVNGVDLEVPEALRVANPFFDFSLCTGREKLHAEFLFEFTSKTDHVPTAQVGDYVAEAGRVIDWNVLTLTKKSETASEPSLLSLLAGGVGLLSIAGVVVVGFAFRRWPRRARAVSRGERAEDALVASSPDDAIAQMERLPVCACTAPLPENRCTEVVLGGAKLLGVRRRCQHCEQSVARFFRISQ
jgi:hypothetical protein